VYLRVLVANYFLNTPMQEKMSEPCLRQAGADENDEDD
jgi:hypothetical protein